MTDEQRVKVNALAERFMLEPTQAPYFVNTPTAILDMERQLLATGITTEEARVWLAQIVEHNIRALQAHVRSAQEVIESHAQGLSDLLTRMRTEIRAQLAREHEGYKPAALDQPKKRGRKPKQGKLL